MGLLAIFGITNDGLNLAVNLLLLFLVVFWIALVYWTYADARRRIADPMLVGCATAASLFPFVGTVVYLIVRPPEYLEDVRERELEIAAAEARLASSEGPACHYCSYEIEKAFLRCPGCLRRLKEPCATCGKPLDPRWSICPYCEADVGQAQAPPQPRPRRRERPPATTPAAAPQRAAPPSRSAAPQRTGEAPPRRTEEPRAPRPAPQRPARTAEGGSRPPRTADGAGRPPRTPDGAGRPPRTADGAGRPPRTADGAGRPPRTADGATRPARTADEATRPARTAEGSARPPVTSDRDNSERPTTRRARP